ncbi:MAG: hypothetical protein ACFFA0_14060 [Promethearchaeota archaeon]
MVDIKENLWLIAIVAGILGIITIFTPAWGYSSYNAYIWFWNLVIEDGHVEFIDSDRPLYKIGIATTIILIIGTLILLFMGIFAKLKEKRYDILGIVGGILLIVAPIVFFAGAASEYYGFFDVYDVNIALFLPFFGGALGVLAGVMGILEKR